MIERVASLVERNAFVVLVLSACAALQAVMSRGSIISDAWYTLLGGRVVSRTGLPHDDVLTTFTYGRDWVDQQWLGHLILYALWSLGGWPLLVLAIVSLYVAAIGLAAMMARIFGASERSVSVVILLCFVAGLPNTVVRAQIIAYPLFALVLFLLLGDERRPSATVFAAFPILVFWANVHGSVVLGAALVALRGATFATGMLRSGVRAATWAPRAALLLIGPWLCIFASPYALALPGYYHRTLANPSFAGIVSEWAPSTVRNQPVFFVLLLPAVWLLFGHGRAISPFGRITLLLAVIAGLLAIRNVVWFALVAAAVLPQALDSAWKPRPALRHRRFNLGLVGAAVAGLVVTATAAGAHKSAWFERSFPRAAGNAVAAAAASDTGLKVFANERYSDWLLFEHPSLRGRIAYDVRFELMTSSQLRAVYDFIYQHGPHWRRAAAGYGLLVLDPVHEKDVVASYVREPTTWTVYRDEHVVVLKLGGRSTR